MDTDRVDRTHMVAAIICIRKRIAIVVTDAADATVATRTSAVNTAINLIFISDATIGVSAKGAGAVLAAIHTGFRGGGAKRVRTYGAIGTPGSIFSGTRTAVSVGTTAAAGDTLIDTILAARRTTVAVVESTAIQAAVR